MEVLASVLIVIGVFGVFFAGMTVGGKRSRRSETTYFWRGEDGEVFKTLKFYGEAEDTPWTKDYPSDYYSMPLKYRKNITEGYQEIYFENEGGE